jgi:1-aminocyclopropane-1-carboxylate synthase
MLSSRGVAAARNQKKDLMFEVMADTYDAKTNPEGFINLGIAENTLMHPELLKYLRKNFRPSSNNLSYGCGPSGSVRLRKALANFFNKHFSPIRPVSPSHINASRGVTSSLERLAYELGDPGDKFLLGRPYYGSYESDLHDRAGIEIAPVSFGDIDSTSPNCVSCYESVILAHPRTGAGRITALLLCNPHNPLGRCYPRETLVALMALCEKHQIHLIIDEIYALSVFPNPNLPTAEPFISALSIPTTNLINPARIHTLWGLSKDFGANSLRIGCVVSQANPTLMSVLAAHAAYSFPSALLDYMACTILEDERFVARFLRESQRRLAENYGLTTAFLRKHGIPYEEAGAGCFVWVDLGTAWRERRRGLGIEVESGDACCGFDDEILFNHHHPQHNSPEKTQLPDFSTSQPLPIGDAGWIFLPPLSISHHPQDLLKDEMDGATNLTDDIERKLVAQRVYLASGDCCGSERVGWFRIVFSSVGSRGVLMEGLRRVLGAVEG